MEALRHPFQTPKRRLTKMYSDTKKSYDTVTEPPRPDVTPELSSLHRKLRIQKDRLITWGLDWSDTSAAQPGDIDESLEREGLSDVVLSVMTSIKEMLLDAERLRFSEKSVDSASHGAGGRRHEKLILEDHWTASDRPRFEDLLRDLTTSIDTLYDLSRSRREQRQQATVPLYSRSKQSLDSAVKTDFSRGRFQDESEGPASTTDYPSTTLARPILSRTESSLQIDATSLVLSERAVHPSVRPPPYESVPTPSNSRTMGYLRRLQPSTNPWSKDGSKTSMIPVLVEYAPFDPVYSDTGISPSLSRLEQLADSLHESEAIHRPVQMRVLNMLGYFDDAKENRYGLVYELPRSIYSGPRDVNKPLGSMMPVTLLSLLRAGSTPGTSFVPNLEDRYHLAHNLAATFIQIHSKGVAHRDVTSNNVVFFRSTGAQPAASGCDVRNPFLCSFDVFSDCDLADQRTAHIYRHPDDKRTEESQSKRAYRCSFDVYGLGLILLEIGLWMPINSFWKAGKYDISMFKSRIETIYAKKLGPKCGSTYMRAVEFCLAVPDLETASKGEGKTLDLQWSLFRSVVRPLERCCAIDDDAVSSAAATVPAAVRDTPTALSKVPAQTVDQPTPQQQESVTPWGATEQSPDVEMSLVPVDPSSHAIESVQPAITVAPRDRQTPRPRLKVHAVDISTSHLEQWHHILLPRLERIMEKALKDPTETFSIDLVGIGDTLKAAKPTIIVTSQSPGRIKSVLKRNFRFDKNLYDLKVRRGKLRRSSAGKNKKNRLPRRSAAAWNAAASSAGDGLATNPLHQKRPLCGASIGAYKDYSHMPAVSFGGVILVDGHPFGMTVHHILDSPSEDDDEYYDDDYEDQSPIRSSAAGSRNFSTPLHAREEPAALHIPEHYMHDDYITDDSEIETEDESAMSDVDSQSDDGYESSDEAGDIEGIAIGDGDEVYVTQPAIDDVAEDFFPNKEDMDEEHLECHTLGHIHASSGIRRWTKNSVTHEIDWALMKIKDERLQPHNIIQGGRKYCPNASTRRPCTLRDPVCQHSTDEAEMDLFPNEVARSHELGKLKVHCVGRTSGLQTGAISPAMSSVRVTGRATASRSWHIVGSFGIAGDSGAWVIDNDKGRVCGHVLAWCDKNCWAYICPMEILMEDIKRTLGAQRVALPGAAAEAQAVSAIASPTPGSSAVAEQKLSASTGVPNLEALRIRNSSVGGSSPADVDFAERAATTDAFTRSGSMRDDGVMAGGRRHMRMEGQRISASLAKA
ncbi:MAG: hypothetical protein M1825_004324 [Sarcosagium campestre]|nr:MAG: hypothetical protein M1825_004324 [Sarcosagium campestre]